MYDIAIVGSGPAGIALAHAAKQCGLAYVVLERANFAQTIQDYPIDSKTHSPPADLELSWGEMRSSNPMPTREETIAHYKWFAFERHHLNIHSGVCVERLERCDRSFMIRTGAATYEASKVILATGGFGVPRRLNTPGESATRVSYQFTDRRPFAGKDVLVVGGGNSAAEAVLQLHQGGANVVLSTRRPPFSPDGEEPDLNASIKEWNVRALNALVSKGHLRIIFSSTVQEITDDAAIIKVEGFSELEIIKCTRIFALLGASPDLSLLRQIGAEIAADGRPVYSCHTYETTVQGLHVAGHMTRELHIANAVLMAPRIIRTITGESPPTCLNRYLHDRCNRALRKLRETSSVFRQMIAKATLVRWVIQSSLNFLQFSTSIGSFDRFFARFPLRIPACGSLSRTLERCICLRDEIDVHIADPIRVRANQDHSQ